MRDALRGMGPSIVVGAVGLLATACTSDTSTTEELAAPAPDVAPRPTGPVPGLSLTGSARRPAAARALTGSLSTVWSTVRQHRRGSTPSFGTGLPFERGGAFELEGATAPGSASFDGAVVWDPESSEMPTAVGGGAFDVTIDGVSFARSDLQSFAAVMPEEETGAPFVLLAGMTIESGPARGDIGYVVYALLPAADVVPGADVTLDGESRMVIFASGPIEAEEPEIAGAATTGRISIRSAGLTIGDSISASVTGDFGAIEWESPGEPPIEGPPPESTGFTPGDYGLTFGPAEVQCDGAYAGRESELAAITPADLGFVDGVVSIGESAPGYFEISGSAVSGAFGGSAVPLDYSPIDSSLALWVGFVDSPAPGPIPRIATYIAIADPAFTGPTLQAQAGAFYGDDTAGCTLAFPGTGSP